MLIFLVMLGSVQCIWSLCIYISSLILSRRFFSGVVKFRGLCECRPHMTGWNLSRTEDQKRVVECSRSDTQGPSEYKTYSSAHPDSLLSGNGLGSFSD